MSQAVDLNILPEQEDMGVSRLFTLIDLERLFSDTPEAKIVNNETLVSQKLSKEYTDAVYSNTDNELGFVPTCQCGAVRGAMKEGMLCPKCGTKCSSQFIDSLSHIAWIGMPESMPPVLHPVWYVILKQWTTVGRKNISAVDIILNPEEEIPDDLQVHIKGRGFQYFYEHADEILDMLLYQYPKTSKKAMAQWIIPFRKVYREMMFTTKLPILHNSLHPLKSNGGTLNFVDSSSKEILAAIIDLSTETYKQHATTVSFKQFNKTLYDIYERVIAYYQALLVEKLGGKTAMLRKHCYGSRIHFSIRSVVVPHAIVLPMDEVELPWKMMVNLHKLQVLNFLVNRHHLSVDQALTQFMYALVQYDPEIDKILEQIVKEYPDGKLALAMGRNPVLAYGSIMLIYCRRWKKDPHDETIGFPAGICGPELAGASVVIC